MLSCPGAFLADITPKRGKIKVKRFLVKEPVEIFRALWVAELSVLIYTV